MATFQGCLGKGLYIKVVASSFKQAFRRIKTFKREMKRLKVELELAGGAAIDIVYGLQLETKCPYCSALNWRDMRDCIVGCLNCKMQYTAALPGDNCRECKSKLECLTLRPFKTNRRRE